MELAVHDLAYDMMGQPQEVIAGGLFKAPVPSAWLTIARDAAPRTLSHHSVPR